MTNIFDEHLPKLPQATEADMNRQQRSKMRRSIEGIGTAGVRAGVIKLTELAALAFDTLEDAMMHAEYPVAVQAAKMVLDRSGFGASQTVKIDDMPDLSNLSDREIRTIALAIAKSVEASAQDRNDNDDNSEKVGGGSIH